MSVDSDIQVVGKLEFRIRDIIGQGSRDSVVFTGTYEGNIAVAIKRVPKAEDHIRTKIVHQNHNQLNIINYYCTEEDQQFRYWTCILL